MQQSKRLGARTGAQPLAVLRQLIAPLEAFPAIVASDALLAKVHAIDVVPQGLGTVKRRGAYRTRYDATRNNLAQHFACCRILHERNENFFQTSTT